MRLASVAVVALAVTLSIAARAQTFSGDLIFTTFSGTPNVHRVGYNYTAGGTPSFTLGTPVDVASLNGADGIVFAPNGNLLVGGQGNAVYEITQTGTLVKTVDPGVTAYHMAVNPDGKTVYASGIPGDVGVMPFPLANGTGHAISGDSNSVTSLAFVGPTTFYTNAGPGGGGDFGTIDLSTFVTTRLQSNVTAAHGMSYDPFTGDLLLYGGDQVSQIDPANPGAILSTLTVSGMTFDQGTIDGKGHIFVADNGGHLGFFDYSGSKLIGSANFQATPFLADSLDDLAPLAGAGSLPPGPGPTGVPEPGPLTLLGGMSFGSLGFALRRFRRA